MTHLGWLGKEGSAFWISKFTKGTIGPSLQGKLVKQLLWRSAEADRGDGVAELQRFAEMRSLPSLQSQASSSSSSPAITMQKVVATKLR